MSVSVEYNVLADTTVVVATTVISEADVVTTVVVVVGVTVDFTVTVLVPKILSQNEEADAEGTALSTLSALLAAPVHLKCQSTFQVKREKVLTAGKARWIRLASTVAAMHNNVLATCWKRILGCNNETQSRSHSTT